MNHKRLQGPTIYAVEFCLKTEKVWAIDGFYATRLKAEQRLKAAEHGTMFKYRIVPYIRDAEDG